MVMKPPLIVMEHPEFLEKQKLIEKRFRDMRSLWRKVLPVMLDNVREVVNSEGTNIDSRWKRNRPKWIRTKKNARPMFRTGFLQSQLKSGALRTRLNRRSAVVLLKKGLNRYYPAIVGSLKKKSNLPARHVFAWAPAYEERAVRLMHDHVEDILREASDE